MLDCMKQQPPKNPFGDEVRKHFLFEKNCWDCGINRNLELDHILGRVSDSILNAYLNCRACHNAKSHRDDGKRLTRAMLFALSEEIQFSKKDLKFYKKNRDKYLNPQDRQ